MPQNTKSINIDGKNIVVKELAVKHIRSIVKGEINIMDIPKMIDTLLPEATNLTMDEIDEMFPTDLQKVYEAFKEVNTPFFEMLNQLGQLGLKEVIKSIFANMAQTLMKPSVD